MVLFSIERGIHIHCGMVGIYRKTQPKVYPIAYHPEIAGPKLALVVLCL